MQSYFMHLSRGQLHEGGRQVASLHQQMAMKEYKIHWPDRISNSKLWKMSGKESVKEQVERKWNWLGYTLRRN